MDTKKEKDIFALSKEPDRLAEFYGKESGDWQAPHIALIADVRVRRQRPWDRYSSGLRESFCSS